MQLVRFGPGAPEITSSSLRYVVVTEVIIYCTVWYCAVVVNEVIIPELVVQLADCLIARCP
jgi:hypothetical protein